MGNDIYLQPPDIENEAHSPRRRLKLMSLTRTAMGILTTWGGCTNIST